MFIIGIVPGSIKRMEIYNYSLNLNVFGMQRLFDHHLRDLLVHHLPSSDLSFAVFTTLLFTVRFLCCLHSISLLMNCVNENEWYLYLQFCQFLRTMFLRVLFETILLFCLTNEVLNYFICHQDSVFAWTFGLLYSFLYFVMRKQLDSQIVHIHELIQLFCP